MADTKNNNRTPLIVSSVEAEIRSGDVVEALEKDGTGKNITELFMRYIYEQVEKIPYNERSAYISEELGINDNMLLFTRITGQTRGQIMLNLDENSTDEQSANWKHLFDPDYKMLFNQKVLPMELL